MEQLASKLAIKIAEKIELDQEKKSVVAYGLVGILQITTLFILITVLGIITGTFYESFIIFFSVGFMRKSTGGAHSKSMWGCNAVSVLSILFLALLSRYVLVMSITKEVNIAKTIAVFAAGLFVFFAKVPVDSPNKPIKSKDKIKRLRKESYMKLLLLFAVTLLSIHYAESSSRLYSVSVSLRVALLWQMFTLIDLGASFLQKADMTISRFLKL